MLKAIHSQEDLAKAKDVTQKLREMKLREVAAKVEKGISEHSLT